MQDAIDIQYTFPIVRGKAPMKLTTNPTTPKTMVQVPWLVMVLKTTEKLASEAAHQQLAGIPHGMDLGKAEFKLAHDVACIP